MRLLTRDQFREAVLARDGRKCVICGQTEQDGWQLDAHHIIERRLWTDGGYYLSNGASLCSKPDGSGCHMKAETTELSVEDIRLAAKIDKAIIPEDMYDDLVYDKWGNVVLGSGKRTKGPLFNDLSVQKVMSTKFDLSQLFTHLVKYPRTYHLPWSPGMNDDDRKMRDISVFEGKRVIVTEKMDGENFTGYNDGCHARSLDSRHHYTRDWAKNFWMARAHELPVGWRICAENLYAVHSIKYTDLPSYLMAFSAWNECNQCLSWDDTVEICQLLEIPMVPVLYDGIFDEKLIKSLHRVAMDGYKEGYVLRLADSFEFKDFNRSVAKYVRANHVQSQKHWFYGRSDHDTNSLREEG